MSNDHRECTWTARHLSSIAILLALAVTLAAVEQVVAGQQPAPAAPAPKVTIQPPDLTNQQQSAGQKTLVVFAHGFNSKPGEWPTAMKAAMVTTPPNNAVSADYIVYDWEQDAKGKLSAKPEDVARFQAIMLHAAMHGQALADHVLKQRTVNGGYEHIHFIGHSLGCRLLQTAAEKIAQKDANNNADLGKRAVIHTTFLDAFTPHPEKGETAWADTFGSSSNWAEHYFSIDLPPTDSPLPRCYNADVTAVDDDHANRRENPKDEVATVFFTKCFGAGRENDPIRSCGGACVADVKFYQDACDNNHSWPPEWYTATITKHRNNQNDPRHRGLGFPLSKEAGHNAWGAGQNNQPQKPGQLVTLPRKADDKTKTKELKLPRRDGRLISPMRDRLASSLTGIVAASDADLALTALGPDDPAWINLAVQAKLPIHDLQFDFEFTSGAEGVLSFYVDLAEADTADEQQQKNVYVLLEEYAIDGMEHSGSNSLGNLGPGSHVLAVRLDAPSGSSSVILQNLSAGRWSGADEIPAVSQWGLVVTALLLLTIGKVFFGRRGRPVGAHQ